MFDFLVGNSIDWDFFFFSLASIGIKKTLLVEDTVCYF